MLTPAPALLIAKFIRRHIEECGNRGYLHQFLCGLLMSIGLWGCGGSSSPPSAPSATTPVSYAALHGRLMGGRQAIVGSTVYVFDAGSIGMVVPVQIGTATTQSDGTFSITSLSPTPVNGDLIYLLAVGGDAGGGINPNATLMSIAGIWGDNHFASNLQINELTTVAVVSQLGNYMAQVPCANIAGSTALSGTCPSILGQSNWTGPVANIAGLVNVSTGQAAAALQSATNPSAAYLTYQNLNLQASVLANCVNSVGGAAGDNSACGDLFFVAASQPTPGSLTLNGVAQWTGAYPMSLTVSPNGQYVYVTNSVDNTISIFQVASDGSLNPVGQPVVVGNYPTDIAFSRDGLYTYVLNEKDMTVSTFQVMQDGSLSPVGQPMMVGDDPIAIAVTPDGQYVCIVNQSDGTVSMFSVNQGQWSPAGSVAHVGQNPNAIAISADSQFAYVVNNDDNTVSTLRIANGALSVMATTPTGQNPYSVAISPNGNFVAVANHYSGSVSLYDVLNGYLSPRGQVISGLAQAGFVKFSPDNRYLYVLNSMHNTAESYSIDSLGNVSHINTLLIGAFPFAMAISPNGQFAFIINFFDSTIQSTQIGMGTPMDTWSAFSNMQANPINTAVSLFALEPYPAVYSPIPFVAPSALSLP